MKKIFLIALLVCCIFLSGCNNDTHPGEKTNTAKINFVDDSGKIVKMEEPAQRIISLYSAHTENLFSLGLDDEIIGVYKSDAYPPRVKEKNIFDYRSDPEKIIAAQPDLVLIRPFIAKSSPQFIAALEEAGINVVSLYPEKFADFKPYIKKLALLTGKEVQGEKLLEKFYRDLEEVNKKVVDIIPKVKVFFESTNTNYRTIAPDSMPAKAIQLAGGINIASDAQPLKAGTSIAPYGAEKILAKGEMIDIYVAQLGAMNSSGDPEQIKDRPGFSAIKAVRNNRIYNIDEKLVSSPTFRFAKGVKELARIFYPQVMDDLSKYNNDDLLTRGEMAEIIVLFTHQAIFSPNSKHYSQSLTGHIYGGFSDVEEHHPSFDYIETAVLGGFINYFGDEFRPEENITRQEVVEILLKLAEIEKENDFQSVIDKDLLQDGHLDPAGFVTGKEVVNVLQKISD